MKFKGQFLIIFFNMIFFLGALPFLAFAQENQTIGLTLSETITAALENNFDIRIEEQNLEIKKEAINKAESVFDLTLSAEGSYADIESAVATSDVVSNEIALKQSFKTGTSYKIGLGSELTDIKNPAADPLHNSTAFFSVTQPLLKDMGTEVNTAAVVIAEKNQEVSLSQLNARVTDIVYSVQKKYWELLQARQILEADKYSLQLANDLVKDNETKVNEGTLASIEVLQARATAASRAVSILSDEQQIRDLEDELRELMNLPGDDPLWEAVIIPESSPEQNKEEIELSEKIEFALENREELKQLRLALGIKDLSISRSKNQLLHTLDLQVGVSLAGEDESFGQSWSHAGNPDTHNYNIGLYLEIPLGNRSAKSDYNTALLEQKQAELNIQKNEQAITTEVKQAVRAVDTAYKTISATDLAEHLAREQLSSELKKFEEGLSTNFQVLDYQDKLASALSDSTRAKVSYQNALDSLDKTIGATMQQHNITID